MLSCKTCETLKGVSCTNRSRTITNNIITYANYVVYCKELLRSYLIRENVKHMVTEALRQRENRFFMERINIKINKVIHIYNS